MELITKSNRRSYLATKSRAYQIGWFAAEKGGSEKITADLKTMYYYEQGFMESMSNSEAINGEVFN